MAFSSDSDSESGLFTISDEEEEEAPVLEKKPLARKKWDSAQIKPPDTDSGSEAAQKWVKRFEKLMLIIAYIMTFIIVLLCAVASKGIMLFMTSQISPKDRKLAFCNNCNTSRYIRDCSKDYEVDRWRPPMDKEDLYMTSLEKAQRDLLETEQIAWIWVLIFAFSTPEVFTLIRSLRSCIFKSAHRPPFLNFLFVFVMETCHVSGLAILAFVALPAFDSAHAAVFSNCLALIPAIFMFISRFGLENKNITLKWVTVALDVLAIFAQLSGIFIVPILHWSNGNALTAKEWAMPVGLALTSFGWWECFIVEDKDLPSSLGLVRWLSDVRHNMIDRTRYFTYLIISLWKLAVFFSMAWGLSVYTGIVHEPMNLFNKFVASFESHGYNVTEISDIVFGGGAETSGALEIKYVGTLFTEDLSPVWVLLVHIGTSHAAYIFSKFACKVQIQGFSYALPLSFVVPLVVALTLSFCGMKSKDSCAFDGFIPGYLFFECPSIGDFFQYIWKEQVWLWAVWFLSQVWIARHIWFPESPRLASTEQIFGAPMYCSLFVDQSVVLNRRRDGPIGELSVEEMEEEKRREDLAHLYSQMPEGMNRQRGRPAATQVHGSDRITKIYGCATMWHENFDEMIEMLKSIFRIDKDYSDRRLSQKYLGVVDRDFYEWETHVFFDDAFELGDNDEEEQVVNQFVKLLVKLMDEAGSYVHCENIRVKPPKKIPTPYGGRLIWVLPGKTKIVCHLKDKSKIRHKKRWSQCMYMYYLLGFKLMELPISDERKQVKAENTYLLALDGDIDFQAESITRLVDLMKKNKDLGAACGRIHPTGSGFMVWYQKFEYAIGHWLQKATEHVMGCVLCSPGCFSLFRGSALMDFNVMAKYTTQSKRPLDYVQYDQGEDRWLCTLLLQQGWRVEYSAASDAFTACPEGFNEFFNQRRRWMPSTIANIFDLLSDAKNVVKVNKDISMPYIAYQVMMMVGTVLGPGTIFLMLVGAFSVAFGITNNDAFVYNLIPIIGFMLVCFIMDGKIQLFVAQILSAIYGLIMMAVLVGILLQVTEDGPLSPSSLSVFLVAGSFILSACLHPQEFWCLPHGIIYYITIPAMYLLLVIYSIFNLNNVSWGTREVAQKKSKKEVEEERIKEAENLKAAKKNQKKDGILGFLMAQAGQKSQKGGLEFSLANLFKVMCFTHDDPAGDANAKLDKIAIEIDAIGKKIGRLESGPVAGPGGSLFRRKSSYGQRTRSISGNNFADPRRSSSIESVHATEALNAESEESHYRDEVDSSEDDSEVKVPKNLRDDNVNPFWIDDRELKNGPIDFLPGSEQQFWNDVIQKYLQPEPLKNAQTIAEQKKVALGLENLRNEMVFTFFMLNAVFVTAIYLLQQNKETIFVRWPLGAKANVSYTASLLDTPTIEVAYEYLQLEPIGLVFVVFFAVVLGIQVVGMLFHRWGTISHIIATTRLAMCERTAKNETPEGAIDKDAKDIVKGIQESSSAKKRRQQTSRVDGRRMTIMENVAAKQKTVAFTNLEKKFKKNLQSISAEDMEKSNNPALRRLATRRGTMKAFDERRNTFSEAARRRSTVRRMSSIQSTNLDQGFNNSAFEDDSAISEDAYSTGGNSRNSQFEMINEGSTSTTAL